MQQYLLILGHYLLASTLIIVPLTSLGAQTTTFVAKPAWQVVTLTGFTRARHTMPLASEMAGKVVSVKADIGEAIGKDGVFACLDATFTRLDLESNQIEQKRLRTQIAYYKKETDRIRKLVQRSTAAQSEFDRLEQDWRDAQYQLQARQVEAKYLREQLRRFCIKAPPGWQVTERMIEPGQWISVGQTIANLGDFQNILVPLALSVREYNALQQQQSNLAVSLPEDGDRLLPARIERISPEFDPQTRKINVDFLITTPLPLQRGGIRVQLALRLPDMTGNVIVPITALQERYEEYFLTRPDGKQVQVVNIGKGEQADMLVISSAEVRAGDAFLLQEVGVE